MAGRNAVRNTIGASHDAKWETTFPWLLWNDSRDVWCCIGRAVESHQHPTLSSAVIQCSDGELPVPNESVIIKCASLYAFCNTFQVGPTNLWYNYCIISGPPDLRLDHQILRAGGPVVHCLKMLISSPGIPLTHYTVFLATGWHTTTANAGTERTSPKMSPAIDAHWDWFLTLTYVAFVLRQQHGLCGRSMAYRQKRRQTVGHYYE